ADEEALAAQPGLDELVGERRGDTESARTGEDEDGSGDVEGASRRPAERQRQREAQRGGAEDAEDVRSREPPPPRGGAGGGELAGARRPEERDQGGRREVAGGHAGERAAPDVERACRDGVAAGEGARGALAVRPVERQRALVLVEERLDDEQIAGGEE